MRARKLITTGVIVAALGAFGAASATAEDTTVTLSVTGGTLSISQASNAASLSTTWSVLGTTADGALPEVTVTDNQNVVGSWAVNASMAADFSDGTNTIAATGARAYVPDPLTVTTSMTASTLYTAGATGLPLNPGGTLVSGSTVLGGGEVTYTPSLQVDIPSGTPNGTYTGTVTQTVSAGS